LFLIGSALGCAVLAFMIGDAESGSRMAWWLTAGFLLLFGMVPPLFFILSKTLPDSITIFGSRTSRTVLTPRLTMTVLGLAMFGWGIWDDPARADWEQGDFSFIILGTFLVGAGVLLLTSLAPMIASSLARAGSFVSKRLASVLPTALAYPLATPFRTAMTMGMFSLVVFAVVVLSGYSALVGNWLGDLGEDARGEWEIVAFGDLDLGDNSSEWDLGEVEPDDFDGIATMNTASVHVFRDGVEDVENNSAYTQIRGFDKNFSKLGGLPLDSWSPNLGNNAEEVWLAIFENETLAIIDYSMAVESYQGEQGVIFEGMGLNIGDEIVVQDPLNPAINQTFFVGAVISQESGWFASGVSVAKPVATERFEAAPSSIWFSLPPGSTLDEQEEVASELQFELVEEGAIVFAIEVVFKDIQSFIFAMFGLLQAFLALGLAVGIAGLGVITIRNVSERSHQTGILRAIGFQRSMVVAGYLAELTWVSLLGILNGAVVGVGFHYQLYVKFLKDEGAEFVLPWGQITMIILGAYLLTVLATAWPVRRAASIHPAEALRDIE
ncbi:MAG: FtsX-like permease family protein, partial [Candidatus Thalassarchaeaceae archaeon]|nr:FtsX-like permease family protein [Candidatus Thalassarchaeaceae archaeon]